MIVNLVNLLSKKTFILEGSPLPNIVVEVANHYSPTIRDKKLSVEKYSAAR